MNYAEVKNIEGGEICATEPKPGENLFYTVSFSFSTCLESILRFMYDVDFLLPLSLIPAQRM